ncbi:hypothetical protein SeLEV6574_g07821 [Synchytrium endobioticum]|uniref:Uncharacterized protein n=1 Tax=Synchytrium endobioticum TaxID=286115 RepID=A0A507CIA9_9FUNG|nr:hypothetical protein SeLEV6574_g07821 [Synchytrium endobioticum]
MKTSTSASASSKQSRNPKRTTIVEDVAVSHKMKASYLIPLFLAFTHGLVIPKSKNGIRSKDCSEYDLCEENDQENSSEKRPSVEFCETKNKDLVFGMTRPREIYGFKYILSDDSIPAYNYFVECPSYAPIVKPAGAKDTHHSSRSASTIGKLVKHIKHGAHKMHETAHHAKEGFKHSRFVKKLKSWMNKLHHHGKKQECHK